MRFDRMMTRIKKPEILSFSSYNQAQETAHGLMIAFLLIRSERAGFNYHQNF